MSSETPPPVASALPSLDIAIEVRPIDSVRPNPRNSRTHSADQIAKVARSMREFGWTNPILVDDGGVVIAGHARLEAARSIGLGSVPCVTLNGLSPEQVRAYVIADNQLALDAGWDESILSEELASLAEAGFDLSLTGFGEDDLARLLAGGDDGHTDPDAAPPLPENPTSRVGDLWLLGKHRVLVGDSTSKADVSRLFGDVKPGLMVTDPPYGVNYDPAWRRRAGLAGSGIAEGKVANDDRADWREAWALFPGDVAYIWHAGTKCGIVAESLEAVKFRVRSQIVWVKGRFAISRGHYHVQHEPAFFAVRDGVDPHWQDDHEVAAYAVREGEAAGWAGDRKQSTVWHIDHVKNDTGHGTQKPVECMKRPIVNNSSPGMAVYDPFLGSGTTLIACSTTGRICFGMELDPQYADVIVRRWEEFTRQEAVLDGDGRTFAQLIVERDAEPGSPDTGSL